MNLPPYVLLLLFTISSTATLHIEKKTTRCLQTPQKKLDTN